MKHVAEPRDVIALPTAIAVIGMAARYPGARNIDELRRNLENGVESIAVFSDRELLAAGVDPALLSNPNYVKAAPLLEDADRFDAAFFEYSPREATIMDPQQRLFLESAWEAIEDAGHAGDVSGTATGVFSGGGGIMSTYLLSDTHFNPRLTGTTASMEHVGNDKDYLSTRVSYKLNLRGPSLTVQTACSTSLVAIHMACQSLLAGECDMALAGGTTVRVPQRTGYLFKEGNVFSRDGHCRAFDAGAQGTVFGSGIGVVVLKRLKDALRDRDPIRAVIRATAINNDGSENKTSYWAPHAEGQAAAMRRALQIAQVDPRTIGYVEAHGTATVKGDPTEVRALRQAFGSMEGARCAIGSVKSNIGHPESAAGVAGLIKAVLSLEHKVLFPSLHYSKPNPEIEFGEGFYVNATRQPWTTEGLPRRAGVNSLGIGGTNAFVILEEAPEIPRDTSETERSCHVLTLSAKSPEALAELSTRYQTFLEQTKEPLADICYTANAGRAHFTHRLAFVASTTEEAAQLVAASASPGPLEAGDATTGRPSRVAFLFTGQGSQYVNMAREIYATNPTFRAICDECARKLSPALERPLLDVLYPPAGASSPIDDTAFTQPALFAIEYALATLWRSWGVEPSVLIGHSIGEIVAATVAGVMTLEDGARLTAARGRLMQALPRDGAMAAVRCSVAQARAAIAPYAETVSIAAINGPHDVVVSGLREHVDLVVSALERDGVAATRLKVSHAFHSPLMDAMLADFRRVAESVTFSAPTIPFISNVTGEMAGADVMTPEYWVRHVRGSVRFADGIAAAHASGVDVFLEIGPHPVLLGMARQSVPSGPEAWLPSLRAGRPDWRQIAESVAALYVGGVDIDWAAFDRDYSRYRVHLPTYAFQRQRYWMDPPPISTSGAPLTASRGALLGHRLRLPHSPEVRFETEWSAQSPAYLNDHRIFQTVVVPGASHIAMTIAALNKMRGTDGCVLEDIIFPEALTLDDEARTTAQLVVKREEGREAAFQVMSLKEGQDENESTSWVVHATGSVGRTDGDTHDGAHAADLTGWQRRCERQESGREFYDRFWQAGYHLTGSFRWISHTWAGDGEVLTELTWPELPDDPAAYPLYPSVIDACFQSVFSDAARGLLRDDAVYVPFSIRRFGFHGSPRPGTVLWCHVAISPLDNTAASAVNADITLCDEGGRLLASIEGCQLREVRKSALLRHRTGNLADALYAVEWESQPRVAAAARIGATEPGRWLVFSESSSPVGAGIIERLRSRGQRCLRVSLGARFSRVSQDHYEVNGSRPEDFDQLIAEVTRDASAPCHGIVHLWSLDAAPMSDPANGSSREHTLGSVLHLVQSIGRAGWEKTRACGS